MARRLSGARVGDVAGKLGGVEIVDETDEENPKVVARALFARIAGRSDSELSAKLEGRVWRAGYRESRRSWRREAEGLEGLSRVRVRAGGSRGALETSPMEELEAALRWAIRGIGARPMLRWAPEGTWGDLVEEFEALEQARELGKAARGARRPKAKARRAGL